MKGSRLQEILFFYYSPSTFCDIQTTAIVDENMPTFKITKSVFVQVIQCEPKALNTQKIGLKKEGKDKTKWMKVH